MGDLGRRVAQRRRELGLSTEEVAARAGMHPSYAELLETSPSPQLTRSALWRLAAALDTTVEALTGSGALSAPGRTEPRERRPAMESLGYDTCQELIKEGGVGRLVANEPRGPVAIPVNFRMLGGDVVFRSAPSALMASIDHDGVSFEVDHIDDALHEGWSVLLSGVAHVITDRHELQLAEALGVTPWAGGNRDLYVRVAPKEVTGRRIRHG